MLTSGNLGRYQGWKTSPEPKCAGNAGGNCQAARVQLQSYHDSFGKLSDNLVNQNIASVYVTNSSH